MALLLLGAHAAENDRLRLSSWGAILLLVVAGWFVVMPPRQRNRAFDGAFVADGFARFAKILILIGAALSILLADEFFERDQIARFELPVLMLLSDPGHAADGVGVQLPVALYGAGAAEPGALCAGRLQPRPSALDRSGPQIFRPGRAVVGHDAVRHFADLWLHRHDRILHHRRM